MISIKDAHSGATVWCISPLTPESPIFASCGSDCKTKFWNSLDGSLIGEIHSIHHRTIRSISFPKNNSDCERTIVAQASFDGTTSIVSYSLNPFSFELITLLEGHESEVKSVQWTDQFLATASRDKSVWIWGWQGNLHSTDDDLEFECMAIKQDHSQDVKNVAWHPTRELLVSTSYDGCWKAYKDVMGDEWECTVTVPQAHAGETIWQAAWINDQCICTVGDDCCIKVWNVLEGGQLVAELKIDAGVFCVSVRQLDNAAEFELVVGCTDSTVRILRFHSEGGQLEQCGAMSVHSADVNSVAWMDNGQKIVSCSDDGSIVISKRTEYQS